MLLPIRFRKRSAAGASGAPSSLRSSEPAYSEKDNVLYYGFGDDGSANATSVIPIAGKGAFADLTTDQTVGGNKTFSNAPIVPTQTSTDSSTKAASTAFVKSQFPTVTATTATKITYNSSGLITGSTTLVATDIPTLTASKISDFDTQVRTSRLDQMAAPTAAVAFNGQRATGLADPTGAQDAATKNYVDNLSQGLDAKLSVKLATTANISLTGAQTIDGVAVTTGDRILVKNQTTASQNGIYVANTAGAWTRSLDMDVGGEFPGAYTFVESGTTNGKTGWVQTTASVVLGTDSVVWTQFSGAGSWLAGTGLSLTGNTFSISATYAGQSTITTVGNVSAGTWMANQIGVFYGGTGAQTPKDARANLGIEKLVNVNNVDYTATASDVFLRATNFTIARTLTLPAASSVNPGMVIRIEAGSSVSSLRTWTVTPSSGDALYLPGGTSGNYVLNGMYRSVEMISDGVGIWYVLYSSQGSTDVSVLGAVTTGTWNADTVAVPYGGTGATTLTGLVKGNGTSAMTAAVVDVDYVGPTSEINGGTF